MPQTLRLPAPHDPQALQRPRVRSGDRALALDTVTVKKQHDPFMRAMQLVGARRIGKERRVVPVTSSRVQYG
jgi:hypothetical protein